MNKLLSAIALVAWFTACTPTREAESSWELKPFIKIDTLNPILEPLASTRFFCPIRNDSVQWEEKDVFNPSAVVRNGKVYLLYRAEDVVGKHSGTSRLGLALSDDGLHFQRLPEPVF
jgi:beta-1,2-mannosidase